jgi:hypothetical protein
MTSGRIELETMLNPEAPTTTRTLTLLYTAVDKRSTLLWCTVLTKHNPVSACLVSNNPMLSSDRFFGILSYNQHGVHSLMCLLTDLNGTPAQGATTSHLVDHIEPLKVSNRDHKMPNASNQPVSDTAYLHGGIVNNTSSIWCSSSLLAQSPPSV